MRRLEARTCSLLVCAFLVACFFAGERNSHAQGKEKPAVAMVGLDALGMDDERVKRLETLFLKELELLTGKRVPDRRAVARLKRRVRTCDGGNKCLAAIGKALRADFVVAGSVASLGDSFVLNIKAVDSKSGKELRRIESDPLRGRPDELIDAIRVAAYRLLAPEELVGSITILADRSGAVVELDGKVIGNTPLKGSIDGLTLGEHALKVDAGDFGKFADTVQVRFQKSTQVVVSLVDLRIKSEGKSNPSDPSNLVYVDPPKRWYQKTWFLITAGIGVAALGGYIGYSLTKPSIINCNTDSGAMPCQPVPQPQR